MLLIGEVAELAGVSASAIRYYESLGLVNPSGRESGKRVFADNAWSRLRAITAAREAGFTLSEIRRLLDSQAEGTEDWRTLVGEKIREVEDRMQRLGAIAQILQESLRCGCTAWDDCTLLVPRQPGSRGCC